MVKVCDLDTGVTYALNACFLICKHKNPKNKGLPIQKTQPMTKMAPTVQYGDGNI